MSFEPLNDFRHQIEVADQAEQRLVNHFAAQLIADGFEGDVDTHAAIKAYDHLAADIPNVGNFGYPVVRDALRWLNYRGMLIDQASGDAAKWAAEGTMIPQDEAEARIIGKGSPIYTFSFANLEKLLGHEQDPEPVDNLYEVLLYETLKFEHAGALTLAMQAADTIVDNGKEGNSSSNEEHGETTASIDTAPPLIVSVSRKEEDSSSTTAYEFAFTPSEDDAVIDKDTGEAVPLRSLTIVETPKGIDAEEQPLAALDPSQQPVLEELEAKYHPPHLGTTDILAVAEALTPGHDYTISRPTSPIEKFQELAEAA